MLIQDYKLRISIALGVGTGLIYLAFMAPAIWSVDGNAMVEVAISLVKNQNFRVSESTGALGVDGYYYSMWYPLPSILAVPFVAFGLLLSQIFHVPEVYIARFCSLLLPPIFTGATTALIALLSFRLGSDRQGACLASLSFAFGTIAIAYTREFYPEPLVALLTILGVYLILGKSNKSFIGAGVSAGLAILAKPSAIVLGPVLSAYLFFKKRPLSVVITPLIGTILGALIYGFYNYSRFGNPMSFGQKWMSNVSSEILAAPVSSREGTLLLGGLLGLLFSPGRGLIWYSPCVILGIVGFIYTYKNKSNFLEALLIIVFSLLFLIINSGGWWMGGWAWGPRYLLPTFPLLLSLAALLTKRWRLALITLATIGFLINAPNLFSFYQRYYVNAEEQKINVYAPQTIWSFDQAPFRQGWSLASEQIDDAMQHDLKTVFKTIGKQELRGALTHIVPVWWWMLPIANIPQWAGALIAMLMTGSGIWLIVIAMIDSNRYDQI